MITTLIIFTCIFLYLFMGAGFAKLYVYKSRKRNYGWYYGNYKDNIITIIICWPIVISLGLIWYAIDIPAKFIWKWIIS